VYHLNVEMENKCIVRSCHTHQCLLRFSKTRLDHSLSINRLQYNYISTMCPHYILEFRNTNSHLLQVYIDVWANTETVI